MGTDKSAMGKRTTKRESSKPRAPRFNDVEFINYELDKVQQAACKEWDATPETVFEMMEAMIGDGYKFTVKYDDYSESVACFVQAVSTEHDNYGYILTGRGSVAWKALKQALYKHHVCFDKEWGAFAERSNSRDIDD